jgi:hypothetical protein
LTSPPVLELPYPRYYPTCSTIKSGCNYIRKPWENDGNLGRAKLPNGLTWEEAENTNTDWINETMGMGYKQMYSLGTSYRTKKYAVLGTLSWDDNGSYVRGNKYSRTSGRINFDYDPTQKTSYCTIYVSEQWRQHQSRRCMERRIWSSDEHRIANFCHSRQHRQFYEYGA